MSFLRIIAPASIAVWISVAGAVEEAGVDEDNALQRLLDGSLGLTVVRRSSSIDADLHGVLGAAQHFSTRSNSSQVSATSSGPCILA